MHKTGFLSFRFYESQFSTFFGHFWRCLLCTFFLRTALYLLTSLPNQTSKQTIINDDVCFFAVFCEKQEKGKQSEKDKKQRVMEQPEPSNTPLGSQEIKTIVLLGDLDLLGNKLFDFI